MPIALKYQIELVGREDIAQVSIFLFCYYPQLLGFNERIMWGLILLLNNIIKFHIRVVVFSVELDGELLAC